MDNAEVLHAVNLYTESLALLDKYDHQSLTKPEGTKPVYRITDRNSGFGTGTGNMMRKK